MSKEGGEYEDMEADILNEVNGSLGEFLVWMKGNVSWLGGSIGDGSWREWDLAARWNLFYRNYHRLLYQQRGTWIIKWIHLSKLAGDVNETTESLSVRLYAWKIRK